MRYPAAGELLYELLHQNRKLPKFPGNSDEKKERKEKNMQVEIPVNKTLKEHLAEELKHASIVYERVYENSLLISQRDSLFFTELFNANAQESYPIHELSEEQITTEAKNNLVFESRFESGNLKLCIKKSEAEYNLYLQNDINTYGNVQWFFFRVSNTTKDTTITFNIKNLVLSSRYK